MLINNDIIVGTLVYCKRITSPRSLLNVHHDLLMIDFDRITMVYGTPTSISMPAMAFRILEIAIIGANEDIIFRGKECCKEGGTPGALQSPMISAEGFFR